MSSVNSILKPKKGTFSQDETFEALSTEHRHQDGVTHPKRRPRRQTTQLVPKFIYDELAFHEWDIRKTHNRMLGLKEAILRNNEQKMKLWTLIAETDQKEDRLIYDLRMLTVHPADNSGNTLIANLQRIQEKKQKLCKQMANCLQFFHKKQNTFSSLARSFRKLIRIMQTETLDILTTSFHDYCDDDDTKVIGNPPLQLDEQSLRILFVCPECGYMETLLNMLKKKSISHRHEVVVCLYEGCKYHVALPSASAAPSPSHRAVYSLFYTNEKRTKMVLGVMEQTEVALDLYDECFKRDAPILPWLRVALEFFTLFNSTYIYQRGLIKYERYLNVQHSAADRFCLVCNDTVVLSKTTCMHKVKGSRAYHYFHQQCLPHHHTRCSCGTMIVSRRYFTHIRKPPYTRKNAPRQYPVFDSRSNPNNSNSNSSSSSSSTTTLTSSSSSSSSTTTITSSSSSSSSTTTTTTSSRTRPGRRSHPARHAEPPYAEKRSFEPVSRRLFSVGEQVGSGRAEHTKVRNNSNSSESGRINTRQAKRPSSENESLASQALPFTQRKKKKTYRRRSLQGLPLTEETSRDKCQDKRQQGTNLYHNIKYTQYAHCIIYSLFFLVAFLALPVFWKQARES